MPKASGVERFKHVTDLTRRIFSSAHGIVYIGPVGIAARAVAGCIRRKSSDPAVVVVDAGGRFAVSLLSGHQGGANELTLNVANALGAEPVISTTTEAVKTVTVGVGCRRGASAARIAHAVRTGLKRAGIGAKSVRWLATAEIKRHEPGLRKAARQLGIPLRIMPDWLMLRADNEVTPSDFVKSKINLSAVAEPAALTSGRNTRLALGRQIINGVTIAVARENCPWSA
ncbi:MAG: cobalamin biosynthesis protein [Verrucomicrobiota bacterium]|nr:cobalamin biosynthesis protein [Verrucomicrobiota bacterium]